MTAPHFQQQERRTLDELVAEIRFVEGFPVWLSAGEQRYFKPYPSQFASPPRMKGREWVEYFEHHYPEIDVTVLSEALSLGELRKNPAP